MIQLGQFMRATWLFVNSAVADALFDTARASALIGVRAASLLEPWRTS
jgi:hypothetical protein